MNNTYRITEDYAISKVDNQNVFLISNEGVDLIQSELALELITKINKEPLTEADLINEFMSKGILKDAILTLKQLENKGYITKEPLSLPSEQSVFWKTQGYDPTTLASLLNSKTVSFSCLGNTNKKGLNDAATLAGIKQSSNPDLVIVLTDDYLNADLKKISKELRNTNTPWLLIKTSGKSPLIGPLFQNSTTESACYSCLEQRLLLHNQEHLFFQSLHNGNAKLPLPASENPLSTQVIINLTLFKVIEFFYSGKIESLTNNVITIDPISGLQEHHILIKRPQCKTCGSHKIFKDKQLQPIELKKTSLKITKQGGYRTTTPEKTLDKYKHHVSAITGIAPYLKEYQSLDLAPVHNFSSGKNLALQSKSMFWLNLHMRSGNGGKGKTEIQAKTGALCEAIERYSIMYLDEESDINTSFNEREEAIHPNDLMCFSKNQYAQRDEINNKSTKFYSLIPQTFSKERIRNWTPVYSLTHKKFKYLPSIYCYAQYPDGDEKNMEAYPDSNGCAAGNTIEEAILQGYLELIERDAAAIWWYNRANRPAVDISNTGNAYIDEVLVYYKSIGRSFHVLDISTDLNVPVFVAVSHNLSTDLPDQILYAFGAHVSAEIALERAVIELNQLLPVAEKKEKGYLTTDEAFIEWLDEGKISNESYLSPSPQLPKKNITTDYNNLCDETLLDAINYCMSQTERQGLETLVLDLTQPDIGMPVAKVMVPGLRHFWRRTAPGRLYDVPKKLGWIPQTLKESELNTWSIFI